MIDNPFDILLITVFTGYILTAVLTWYLMKNVGLTGVLIGIASNSLIHLNLLYNGERIFSGGIVDVTWVLKGTAYVVLLNVVFAIGAYLVMRSKSRPFEMATVLGLLISSMFFWHLYVPVIFAIIILTYPAKSVIND